MYSVGMLVASMMLVTVACGGGKGKLHLDIQSTGAVNNTPPNSKVLFSVWTEINNFYSIDLRGAVYGQLVTVPVTLTGQACSCGAIINGGETSGTVSVANCTGAAQCSSFGTNGTYTRSGANLSICASTGSCSTLR